MIEVKARMPNGEEKVFQFRELTDAELLELRAQWMAAAEASSYLKRRIEKERESADVEGLGERLRKLSLEERRADNTFVTLAYSIGHYAANGTPKLEGLFRITRGDEVRALTELVRDFIMANMPSEDERKN